MLSFPQPFNWLGDTRRCERAYAKRRNFKSAGGPLKVVPLDREMQPSCARIGGKASPGHRNFGELQKRHDPKCSETDLPAGTRVLAAAEYVMAQLMGFRKIAEVVPKSWKASSSNRVRPPLHRASPKAQCRKVRIHLVTGGHDTPVISMINIYDFALGASDDTVGIHAM
jgi:hypothetical protein